MIRKEAIDIVCNYIKNDIIISANGFISRDVYSSLEKNTNFYMIGSMGLASSIALGIALKKPKRRIFVFDGDGNILMNLGSLVTIGTLHPKNLIHIIFDNKIHESTGGQPTQSKKINILKIAKATNYLTYSVNTKKSLENVLKKISKSKGPILIHVLIKKSNAKSSRVDISPKLIKNRFMNAINK
ncbi:MAG: sulfopyruvate decarboxylase subunit beta [Dehalococcoidia bacterium]|nr:sulfopyruvate decarboxylase subunit beta [Dehalococcoidia bacterium]